jgi:homospermidine synthase
MRLLRTGTTAEITATRVLRDEIADGIDELGVFLISGTYPSLWLGSHLSAARARELAALNNATSLQVVSSLVAAMAWTTENPNRGVLESEELDHEFIYEFACEYWSPIVQQIVSWKPGERSTNLQFSDFLLASDGRS